MYVGVDICGQPLRVVELGGEDASTGPLQPEDALRMLRRRQHTELRDHALSKGDDILLYLEVVDCA